MAIFIARALAGGGGSIPAAGTVDGSPYNCVAGGVSIYTDVLPTDIFCKHVHFLAVQKVTSGCSPTLYCPDDLVDAIEMAASSPRALVAPVGGNAVPLTYGPDPITGLSYSCNAASPSVHFTDVPASDPFCKHVHYLWAKGIVAGCTGDRVLSRRQRRPRRDGEVPGQRVPAPVRAVGPSRSADPSRSGGGRRRRALIELDEEGTGAGPSYGFESLPSQETSGDVGLASTW